MENPNIRNYLFCFPLGSSSPFPFPSQNIPSSSLCPPLHPFLSLFLFFSLSLSLALSLSLSLSSLGAGSLQHAQVIVLFGGAQLKQAASAVVEFEGSALGGHGVGEHGHHRVQVCRVVAVPHASGAKPGPRGAHGAWAWAGWTSPGLWRVLLLCSSSLRRA